MADLLLLCRALGLSVRNNQRMNLQSLIRYECRIMNWMLAKHPLWTLSDTPHGRYTLHLTLVLGSGFRQCFLHG